MLAREMMTADPQIVTPGDPLLRAASIMRDLEVGAVAVVENRDSMRPVGIITDRDIAIRHVAAGHPYGCTCAHVMTRGPLAAVSPDTPVDEVVAKMAAHRLRRMLVVENGALAGIIEHPELAGRDAGHPPFTLSAATPVISGELVPV